MMPSKQSPPAEQADGGAVAGATAGPAKVSDPESASFEEAIRRMAQIVEQLERGDLPLEASLALFEEGVRLARISQQRLDRAERRIEELLGLDAGGQMVTRPFEVKLDGG
jgi:exodeoxyribonuclease VII small subunit